MKKSASLLLAVLLLFSFACPAFSEQPGNEMKDFLLKRGYPEEYLDSLIDLQIEFLYDSVSKNDAHFVSLEEKSAETGTPFFDSEVSLTLVLSAVTVRYESENYIEKVLVNATYDWKSLPLFRSTDAMSVSWDYELFSFKQDSFLHCDYAKNRAGEWLTYKEWDAPASISFGSVATYPEIRYVETARGSARGAAGLRGSLCFELVPKEKYTSEKEAADAPQITAIYAHDEKMRSSFYISGGAIGGLSPKTALVSCEAKF